MAAHRANDRISKDWSRHQPLPTLQSRWTACWLNFFRMLLTWPCGYQVDRLSCCSQICRRDVSNRRHKATHSRNVYFFLHLYSIHHKHFSFRCKTCTIKTCKKRDRYPSSHTKVEWGTQASCPWSRKFFFNFYFCGVAYLGAQENIHTQHHSAQFFFIYVDNSKVRAAQSKKLTLFFYASPLVYTNHILLSWRV